MGPITKNEPFNMFVFFKEGISSVVTSLKLNCFDSTKNTILNYEVQIQNTQEVQEVLSSSIYKLGVNRVLKQIENDLQLGGESDIYFAEKSDLSKKLVQLSIANQVLSTKTAFICVVEEGGDSKRQELADKGQQKVIVPQLLSQDYQQETNCKLIINIKREKILLN